MKLTWHIVRKDGRHLWVPLALWALLITVKHGADWRSLHVVTEDGVLVERIKFFAGMLFVLQVLVGYLLAAALVLEDLPTGTMAFWMTRPVTGARLLGAKVLACAVFFGVLPVIVSLPWWAASGLETREIFSRSCELLCWHGWAAGLAVVVAAFTGSLGQFLAWTLALPALAVAVVMTRSEGRSLLTVTIDALDAPMRILAIVVLCGFATAVLMQYQMRRRRVALGLLGASVAGALAVALHLSG